MGKIFVNTPTLETERLILRRFTEKDLDAIFDIFCDIEINTYLPWFPLKSEKEAKAFFAERYENEYRKPRGYRYAVCLKTDDIPIGYVNVSTDDSHDLGYGLRKKFWHKGIITEAGEAVLEQVKKDGLPYITATHDINNPRSGKVMKKLGMQYKYSYKEQWQPKDISVAFRMYQLNFDGNEERTYMEYWNRYEEHFVENNLRL